MRGEIKIQQGRAIVFILFLFIFQACAEKFPAQSIITTFPVTAISSNSAASGGEITDPGSSPITSRGVCWNTSPDPTTEGYMTIDGTGTGQFFSSMNGLIPSTIYYVRAYASNSNGTIYGETVVFRTSAPSK